MLILARRRGEVIVIGDDIRITVIRMNEQRVWLGIDAPEHIPVNRREVAERDTE